MLRIYQQRFIYQRAKTSGVKAEENKRKTCTRKVFVSWLIWICKALPADFLNSLCVNETMLCLRKEGSLEAGTDMPVLGHGLCHQLAMNGKYRIRT
jgi:hypothetical protein